MELSCRPCSYKFGDAMRQCRARFAPIARAPKQKADDAAGRCQLFQEANLAASIQFQCSGLHQSGASMVFE